MAQQAYITLPHNQTKPFSSFPETKLTFLAGIQLFLRKYKHTFYVKHANIM